MYTDACFFCLQRMAYVSGECMACGGRAEWMKVVKALSNNMVLMRDQRGKTCICQGKGIGFHKRVGDSIDERLIERCFLPASPDESRHFQKLFSEISDKFWEIAEEVVDFGREHYGIKVSQKIILPLCDHMAGSVERYKKGIVLENPMLWDVKRVYPKEFKIGRYALRLLEENYGILMKDDEAAFLAYHFVNAQLDSKTGEVLPDYMTMLASRVIDLVQQSFQIVLDEEDWNYQRFLTHLKFFVKRVAVRQAYEEDGNNEMYQAMRLRYPQVGRCIDQIADIILIDFHYDISIDERLYLMIHIKKQQILY